MKKFKLRKITFNNDETNHTAAIQSNNVVVVITDDEKEALYRIREYFRELPLTNFYLGWDKKVYPQFVVEVETNK